MNRFDPLRKSSRVRKVAARIAGCTFDYRRVGHDHRLLTFLENGLVGQGAEGRETFWDLGERNGRIVLEIYSSEGLTCRLVEGADKVWRGRWQVCERMPVELSPLAGRKSANLHAIRPWRGLGSQPPSLFVVSLPRSLSTLIYHGACQAAGLSKPRWALDGEILNLDRFKLYPGPTNDTARKFILEASEPRLFHDVEEFLDQVASPFGYGYKDVVQPFIIATWIKRTQIRTIRIKRNLADIAYSMIERGWHYPAQLFPKTKDREYALVRGLVQAERALETLPPSRLILMR